MTPTFQVFVQKEPGSTSRAIDFETEKDDLVAARDARFKFNDAIFKASCGPHNATATIQLFDKDKLIKTSKADKDLVAFLMEIDIAGGDVSESDDKSDAGASDDSTQLKSVKKSKYIDGEGKEIDMPKNAYMHFCIERRGLVKEMLEQEWLEVAKDFVGLSEATKTRSIFGNTTRRLSMLWNFARKEVRSKYNDLAASDKARFDQQMATNPMNAILFNEEKELKSLNIKRKNAMSYDQSCGYLNESEYMKQMTRKEIGGGNTSATQYYTTLGSSQTGEQSSKKKPKTAKLVDSEGVEIKKPITSYFHFCAEHRSRVAKEITSSETKAKQAKKIQDEQSASKSSSENGKISDGGGTSCEVSDEDRPFSRGVNRDCGSPVEEGRLPEKEIPCITKVVIRLGELWRALSPEEKQVYDEMAAKDKIRYEAAIQSNPINSWIIQQEKYAKMSAQEVSTAGHILSESQQGLLKSSHSSSQFSQHHPCSSLPQYDVAPDIYPAFREGDHHSYYLPSENATSLAASYRFPVLPDAILSQQEIVMHRTGVEARREYPRISPDSDHTPNLESSQTVTSSRGQREAGRGEFQSSMGSSSSKPSEGNYGMDYHSMMMYNRPPPTSQFPQHHLSYRQDASQQHLSRTEDQLPSDQLFNQMQFRPSTLHSYNESRHQFGQQRSHYQQYLQEQQHNYYQQQQQQQQYHYHHPYPPHHLEPQQQIPRDLQYDQHHANMFWKQQTFQKTED